MLASEAPGLVPARVLTEERGLYLVASESGERPATPSGRLRHDAELDPTAAWPAVGDWVALEPGAGEHGLIQRVLSRHSAVIRRSPGDRRLPAQVLAANVDVAFVVTSMNAEFNARRLERYLAVAWESGATPVVLLSKADLVDDPAGFRAAAEAVAAAVEVIAVSVVTGNGLDAVRARLGVGRTVAFIGSSGVGKSSIVNALAGEPLLDTAAIRDDDARGRHTTTRRQLVRLADGLLIDTPGLRELGVLDGEGVSTAFEDVEGVAAGCRFNDCQHRSEPGCAVRAALHDGTLQVDRLDAYNKLQREAHRAVIASDALARRAERRKWTTVSRSVEQHMRLKYGAER
jgi:ribosome biogenesis GTPase